MILVCDECLDITEGTKVGRCPFCENEQRPAQEGDRVCSKRGLLMFRETCICCEEETQALLSKTR